MQTYAITREHCLIMRVIIDPELDESGNLPDSDMTGPHALPTLAELVQQARASSGGYRFRSAYAIAEAAYGQPADVRGLAWSCDTLDEMLQVLRDAPADELADIDLSRLPCFGGEEPTNTLEVWSWDAERLLVGTCPADFNIIPRGES